MIHLIDLAPKISSNSQMIVEAEVEVTTLLSLPPVCTNHQFFTKKHFILHLFVFWSELMLLAVGISNENLDVMVFP